MSPPKGATRAPRRVLSGLAWFCVAVLGAAAAGGIALHRGESISSLWFIAAAVCIYALGYRFYSAFIAARVLCLDPTRATPAERLNDGRDFVPTDKWIVFGHHFAAIAGPGPLIGPTLAAQFGYLPGTLAETLPDTGTSERGNARNIPHLGPTDRVIDNPQVHRYPTACRKGRLKFLYIVAPSISVAILPSCSDRAVEMIQSRRPCLS